jgi:hypothetical protein
MATPRASLTVLLCVAAVRLFSALVPARARREWRLEWEAELRHRGVLLEARRHIDWRHRMDLFRRVLGALPDAAWLRRQVTADADIVHDLRHGARMLRKSPTFTVSAVFILAIGLGGTVSIVTLLDTLLFRPLPYLEAERVMTLWQRRAAVPEDLEDVSPANFVDWRERSVSFSALAAVVPYSHDHTGGREPEVLFGAQVTEGFWDALGMQPAVGRGFLPEEHVRGARAVVIISHGLWQRRLGSDPAIVNKTISMDGEPWTIVGVLPREFAPQLMPRPGELDVWTPKIIQDHEKRTRGSAWWNAVQHDADVGSGAAGAGAVRHGNLRGHQLHDHAEDQGDRGPDGARRRRARDSANGAARRQRRHRRRPDLRPRRRARAVAVSGPAVVRSAAGRSSHHVDGVFAPRRRGSGRLLPACAPRDPDRPGRSIAGGVISCSRAPDIHYPTLNATIGSTDAGSLRSRWAEAPCAQRVPGGGAIRRAARLTGRPLIVSYS